MRLTEWTERVNPEPESRQSESRAAGGVINRLFFTEEHRLHLRVFEIGAVSR